jgi:hypothetical protein
MDRLIETRHIAAAYQRDVIVAASSQQQEDLSKWLFQLTTTGDKPSCRPCTKHDTTV